MIQAASHLRVIGRAGTGVDNVDVEAATRRGIIVCNAAGSNALSAAEHTIALLLAQARNVAQAHAALVDGRWERSKYGGIELDGKTLGILGFGRIGQMVAERAQGLGMRVVRLRPICRRRALPRHRCRAGRDSRGCLQGRRLHHDSSRLDARDQGLHQRRGTRVDAPGRAAAQRCPWRSRRSGGAGRGDRVRAIWPAPASTCSRRSHVPTVRCSGCRAWSSRPHLGASTAEAQDRAGIAVAEQVTAALTGGVVTSAVNIPAVSAQVLEVIGPYLPLAREMGQLMGVLAGRRGVAAQDRVRGRDRRPRHPHALDGGHRGRAGRACRRERQPGQRLLARRGARHRVDRQLVPADP